MIAALHGFLLALQFLTRLPVPVRCPWNAETSRWAVRCYPLVGMLLGTLVALGGYLLGGWLPTPLLSLALLSLWVILSGGLHLDGLMDVADAWGSNATLERRWAIMKDPHVGSFGILALVFLLLWKAALLMEMLETPPGLVVLVMIPAVARFGAVVLLVLMPAARPEGMAREWKQHLTRRDLILSLWPVAFGLALPVEHLLLLVGLMVSLMIFLLLYGLAVLRTFKGINGDIVGAAIEGGELWLLLAAWTWWSFVTV